MPASKKRLHEWAPAARRAYLRTLEYIAADVNYSETLDGIKIVRWYRQRQNIKK